MPKGINPIRKAKVKEALSRGIDAKNAMLGAGYSPNTAHTATAQTIVKSCHAEIAKDIASQITPENIFARLNDLYDKADDKGKYDVCARILEMFGKNLKMWSNDDRPAQNIALFKDVIFQKLADVDKERPQQVVVEHNNKDIVN